jgi:hypothetical protein
MMSSSSKRTWMAISRSEENRRDALSICFLSAVLTLLSWI